MCTRRSFPLPLAPGFQARRESQRSRPVCKGTIGIDVALCGNCINCAEQIIPNNIIVKGKVECGV